MGGKILNFVENFLDIVVIIAIALILLLVLVLIVTAVKLGPQRSGIR